MMRLLVRTVSLFAFFLVLTALGLSIFPVGSGSAMILHPLVIAGLTVLAALVAALWTASRAIDDAVEVEMEAELREASRASASPDAANARPSDAERGAAREAPTPASPEPSPRTGGDETGEDPLAEIASLPVPAILLLHARAGRRMQDALEAVSTRSLWVDFARLSLVHPVLLMEEALGLLPEGQSVPPDLSPGSPVPVSAQRHLKEEDRRINDRIQGSLRSFCMAAQILSMQRHLPNEESKGTEARRIHDAMITLIVHSGARLQLDPGRLLDQFVLETVVIKEVVGAHGWNDGTTLATDPIGPLWREFDKSALFAGEPIALVQAAASGPGAPAAGDTINESTDHGARFVERMVEHRRRMLDVDHPDGAFIEQAFSDEALAELARFAGEKMQMTQQDGDPHSMLLDGEDLCIVILTIRADVPAAAGWFAREWGGYVTMIDRYLGGPEATASSASAFCHVTFGCEGDGGSWVNLTLMPLAGDCFRSHPILALDLMSEAEKARTPRIVARS